MMMMMILDGYEQQKVKNVVNDGDDDNDKLVLVIVGAF